MKASKLLKTTIIVGIGLRVILWCVQSAPEGDDGARYLRESINMVEYGVFSTANSETPLPSAHDMPLWPSMMAVAYWLTDSVKATQYIAGMTNIVLVLSSVLFLVSMLRYKPFSLNDKQITISVGVLLFMPDSVMYSLFHMPDQLAVFAVIVALWFYFRGLADDWRYFICSIFAFLVSIYAKPICIPLSAGFIIAIPFIMLGTWTHKLVVVVVSFGIVGLGLCPWVMRNKIAFGTAGITSIAGTNLYGCNWGRLVDTLAEPEKSVLKTDMARFESEIATYDLMKRSQMQGDYAKKQIFSHLPEYCIYTAKKHPRLYAGTGTVALLRYLGLERACDALDAMWGSGNARGFSPSHKKPYTFAERSVGVILQIISWVALLIGYILVVVGSIKGIKKALALRYENRFEQIITVMCPILSLLLVAAVIGPITATRYRFIMIPFFAILSGYAVAKQNPHSEE